MNLSVVPLESHKQYQTPWGLHLLRVGGGGTQEPKAGAGNRGDYIAPSGLLQQGCLHGPIHVGPSRKMVPKLNTAPHQAESGAPGSGLSHWDGGGGDRREAGKEERMRQKRETSQGRGQEEAGLLGNKGGQMRATAWPQRTHVWLRLSTASPNLRSHPPPSRIHPAPPTAS